MKQQRRKSQKPAPKPGHYRTLIKWVGSIALVAFGLILLISLKPLTLGGPIGDALFTYAFGYLGVAAYLLPVVVIGLGLGLMLERTFASGKTVAGGTLIIVALLGLMGLVSHALGGVAGDYVGQSAVSAFGIGGALIILLAVSAVGAVLVIDIGAFLEFISTTANKTKDAAGDALSNVSLPAFGTASADASQDSYVPEEPAPAAPEKEPVISVFNRPQGAEAAGPVGSIANFDAEYNPPPLSLLGSDTGKPGTGDIKANANIIKRTFQNFGINVEMDEVSVGPTVTRYAVKPAEGVRLSKIISLQSNLELALAAHPVRIEAPIPGKSLVGIEVPNSTKATVGLAGIISVPEWTESKKPLLAAIGRDITGTPHYVNVAKMPHGLVAGATGSGKSVAIHALITSLLYRNGPNQLRFIMVDPKRVELTGYNGIPHLLTPVITDPKKCILSLKWAAKEMERRYNILETEAVRDIESYHNTIVEPARKKKSENMPEAMPYIVIVIDELADIMQSYPRELEASIVRLAQMSRAVGIHLVLSTQRPSVNVITGLIKANVPTRMALQVASQIDSRTIIDSGGAEMLLGAGDMLYLSSDMQKPVRIQTAYISEAEVKKVVAHIKANNAGDLSSLDLGANGQPAEPNDAVMFSANLEDSDVDDDLYEQAKAAVEEAGRASTSYLQRKLRIGYSRAARLMDLLEEKGVIGAADGSRPREVLSRAGSAPADDVQEEF